MIVPPQARPLVTNLLPETVAKYFTRDVVDVELLAEDEVPEIEQRAEELRARSPAGFPSWRRTLSSTCRRLKSNGIQKEGERFRVSGSGAFLFDVLGKSVVKIHRHFWQKLSCISA